MPNFAALKSEVLALVIDTPTTVQSYVGSYVNRAIRSLQKRHGFKDMEASTTLTTTISTRILGARPALWKQARGKPYFIGELDGFAELEWTPQIGQAVALYGDNPDFDFGAPAALYEDAVNLQFLVYPYPDGLSTNTDGEYRITVPYWSFTSDLVSDTDQNWFTDNAEDYIIYKAVSDAHFANQDEQRADVWAQRARQEFDEVKAADKDRRMGEVTTFVPYTGALMPHITGR